MKWNMMEKWKEEGAKEEKSCPLLRAKKWNDKEISLFLLRSFPFPARYWRNEGKAARREEGDAWEGLLIYGECCSKLIFTAPKLKSWDFGRRPHWVCSSKANVLPRASRRCVARPKLVSRLALMKQIEPGRNTCSSHLSSAEQASRDLSLSPLVC